MKAITWATAVLITFLHSGCFWYKVSVQTPPGLNQDTLVNALSQQDRYLILHFSDTCIHLGNPTIDSSTKTLSGTFDSIPMNHQLYVRRVQTDKNNRMYKPEPYRAVAEETHLYSEMTISSASANENTIPFNSVYKIDQISKSKVKSIVGTVLVSSLVLVSLTLAYVSTRSLISF